MSVLVARSSPRRYEHDELIILPGATSRTCSARTQLVVEVGAIGEVADR